MDFWNSVTWAATITVVVIQGIALRKSPLASIFWVENMLPQHIWVAFTDFEKNIQWSRELAILAKMVLVPIDPINCKN